MDIIDALDIIDKYALEGISYPLDVKLKTGELIETDANLCSSDAGLLTVFSNEERGSVIYHIEADSIAYIKIYGEEWHK